MKYEYSMGDQVRMNLDSALMVEHELEEGEAEFFIDNIDEDEDDDLPYCIGIFIDGVEHDTHWVHSYDIKGFASVVKIGGE